MDLSVHSHNHFYFTPFAFHSLLPKLSAPSTCLTFKFQPQTKELLFVVVSAGRITTSTYWLAALIALSRHVSLGAIFRRCPSCHASRLLDRLRYPTGVRPPHSLPLPVQD
jgi:hypothetical protein